MVFSISIPYFIINNICPGFNDVIDLLSLLSHSEIVCHVLLSKYKVVRHGLKVHEEDLDQFESFD